MKKVTTIRGCNFLVLLNLYSDLSIPLDVAHRWEALPKPSAV
jgi:hypothetical protein